MLTKTHANQYNSKMLPFNDGICKVYTIEKRTVKGCLGQFDFREETVGIKAFAEFQTLGIQVDKVISIPMNNIVDVGRLLKINQEDNYYKINLIQKKDTLPTSLRLTLTKTNIKWTDDDDTKYLVTSDNKFLVISGMGNNEVEND